MREAADLAGQRFGRLTAIERLPEKSGSCYLWRCVCDCGNEVKVRTSALLNGNTKSCGCMKRERLVGRSKDITGQRFGTLTALYPLPERYHGSVVWRCVCDCGKETDYSYNELAHCGIKSCGCARYGHDPLPLHYIDGTCVEQLNREKPRSDNTSGYTGVVRTKKGWRAQIGFKGKIYYLGTFQDVKLAALARKRAEQELHGAFLEWYEEEQARLAAERKRPERTPRPEAAGRPAVR